MATERKNKLLRVLQILETTDEKSPMNAAQIICTLDLEFDLENVSRGAIYDDINSLISCGYKIRQCEDIKKGWYMEDHTFEDWEIKIMMDTIQQAKCVSADEASVMKKKLLGLISDRSRSRFAHLITQNGSHNIQNVQVGQYIEMMLEAMYTGRKIEFQYTELTDDLQKVLKRNGHIYKLNLYTIYWAGNNYYLIGAHDHREELTNYRLDRVLNLTISQEAAVPAREKIGANPDLFIQSYIERSVLCFSGEEIRIEVEYEPNPVNNNILYDFAGTNVKVRKLENGKARAMFKKADTVTLVGWFMQYSNRFQVTAPDKLKENIVKELNRALEGYN